jgi:hypothetical protein
VDEIVDETVTDSLNNILDELVAIDDMRYAIGGRFEYNNVS